MYHILPDPYPGRCPNFRNMVGPSGEHITLRCIDYANTRHVCEFPEPAPPAPPMREVSWTQSQVPAEPWVKPPARTNLFTQHPPETAP